MGYLELLRTNRPYRRLWQSRVCSLLGDWFNLLALFAMLREVGEQAPLVLGSMFILKLLPIFLFGPVAGVLADRFNRTTIMIVADLLRLAVVLSFFLVPFFPEQAGMLTLILVFTQATISAFFEPARIALLPNLTPGASLLTANALGAITWSTCYALGTALGGLMTHALGWRAVLVLDAASFILSAVLVAKIGFRDTHRAGEGKGWMKALGIQDLIDGFKYLSKHPRATYVMMFKAGLAMSEGSVVVLTLLGERYYTWGGRPDLGVGAMLAARAVGTGLGPVFSRPFVGNNMEYMRRAMLLGFVINGIGLAALSWVTNPYAALFCAMLSTTGGSMIWVYSTVSQQQLVIDRFRGRVASADLGLATLIMASSLFLVSRTAEQPGQEIPTIAAYLAIATMVACLTLYLIGQHRNLKDRFWPENSSPET